ncbi:MAG: helix-turn-helix domain-containing protein [bacterium]|nr:helix-turn-helix domain-containing protein [bacterium]
MAQMMLTLLGPGEMGSLLGDRVNALRLGRGWTRQTLASRASVSPSSLKRFETTGKASLELVLKVAGALSRLDEFSKLLQPPSARSIEELERRTTKPLPRRGRI